MIKGFFKKWLRWLQKASLKSQLFYFLFRILYVDNLWIADEGCLIYLYDDAWFAISKKSETRGESQLLPLMT